jgi:acyl carrier protein
MPEQNGAADRAWVIRAILRRAPDYPGIVYDETPLAEGGICLDSLALSDLIAEIDALLGRTIPDEEITVENFGTLGQLLTFLTRQKARPPEP